MAKYKVGDIILPYRHIMEPGIVLAVVELKAGKGWIPGYRVKNAKREDFYPEDTSILLSEALGEKTNT
jgi:hypothetical protein